MRRLFILGVAALTTVGLLGTSCSSDKTTGGTATTTGGSSSTAGTGGTDTGSTAGNASTGGSKAAGTGTGGATSAGNTGGAAQGGSTGALTGGVATPGHYYTQGTLTGYTWTAKDVAGSTITLAANEMCATGTAIKIPNIDGGTTPDYSGAWGVDVGWNLNQSAGVDGGAAGPENGADLSGLTSLTLAINGATGLTLRVQVEVVTAGVSAYYCASIPAAGGTVLLSDLKTQCYSTTGNVAFDKATMRPKGFALQVVTDTAAAHPFNFCVTALTFQ